MSDLSTKTWNERKGGGGIFKALSEKNMQPSILYPAKLSFRIDGEIKTLQNRQLLTNFITTKPAIQKILRGVLESKKAPKLIQNRMSQSIEMKTLLATWHH